MNLLDNLLTNEKARCEHDGSFKGKWIWGTEAVVEGYKVLNVLKMS